MPEHRSKRTRVATGIYRDSMGYEIQICVDRERASARFPLSTERGYLEKLRAERESMRVALRTTVRRRASARAASGTLAADAPVYLGTVAAMPSIADRTAHIAHWVEHLGAIPRAELTAPQIRRVVQHWLTTPRPGKGGAELPPYAPETVRHHLKALRHLYVVLDGKGAPNPARDVPLPKAPRPEPRELPLPAVVAILRQFAYTSKTRARLEVIVTTGLSHSEVMRLRPEHVRLAEGVVIALGRRKGGGTAPRAVPLTRFSRHALRAMARLNAWGRFSQSSMRSRFRDACARAGYGDTDWRPYDLRHTIATQIARRTGDERAVQAWLGHRSLTTTARYTLGSVDARLAAAAQALTNTRRR